MITATCGGDVTHASVTIAQNLQDPGSLERAYVKCFEGHGVDAHIAEGGGIQFDSGGNLSMEETQALIEECQEQLEQLGLKIQPEIDDDWLRARFEEIEAVRDCLLDHEQPVPDLVSLETYLEDPDVQPNPYDVIKADPALDGTELREIIDACPDPGEKVIIEE